MNTTENNKIIAEFMGYIDNGCSKEGFLINPITNFNENIDSLKYHSDWNWLMEVAEKIKKLGYWIRTQSGNNGTFIHIIIGRTGKEDGIVAKTGSKNIKTTYNACVDFVNWYHQKNKSC